MDDKAQTSEKDELSLPKSVEVEEIIEFYKSQTDDIETVETTPTKKQVVSDRIYKFISKIPFINIKTDEDDSIQSQVYGLSEKGRILIQRIISGIISVLIIIGSFVLAYYLPGIEEKIKEYSEKYRSEPEYTEVKTVYDSLKSEVDNLKTDNAKKEDTIAKINDIDNTKAEIRAKITQRTYELNELNAQIAAKRIQIDELNKSISEKSPPETVYPPGKYIAGKNIPKGKYSVTGTGKLKTASSSGKSKINITLGSTPLEVTLSQDDVIKFDGKVKFTPMN